jgi:hypothetical protein
MAIPGFLRSSKVFEVNTVLGDLPQQWLRATYRPCLPPDSSKVMVLNSSPGFLRSRTRVGRGGSSTVAGEQGWLSSHQLIQLRSRWTATSELESRSRSLPGTAAENRVPTIY